MRHVALGESEFLGPGNPDHAARAASIAAMGQRLAAAGPRTRLRLSERPTLPAEIKSPPPAREPAHLVNLIAERSVALAREAPPMPRRPWPAWAVTLRRATLLGATAAGGFALVLLAQSPRWAMLHLKPKHDGAAIQASPDAQTASAEAVATQDVLPSAHITAPEPVRHFAELATPPRARVPATPGPDPVMEKFADAPVARIRPPARTMFATLPPAPQLTMPAGTHDRAPLPRPVHVTLRQVSKPVEPIYKVAIARHELPRWLTEPAPTQPRVLVMSPQPHNLEPPASATPAPQLAAAIPERPRPALPPIPQRPRLVYASTSYPQPAPYRAMAYPPYYSYPYGYYQGPP